MYLRLIGRISRRESLEPEKQTIGINHEYFFWVDHTSVHKIAAKEPLTMNAQNPAASSGKRSTLVSRVSCGTESDWLLTLATSYAVYFRYIPPYTTARDVRRSITQEFESRYGDRSAAARALTRAPTTCCRCTG